MSFRIWNCWRIFSGGGSFRSGVQPPTGTRMTGIPRLAQGWPAFRDWHKQERINNTISALRFRFPCLRGRTLRRPWALSRSGVAPPTGTIHPRESRGTTDGKQESNKRFISGRCLSGFGIADGYLAGVELSGRGFNPRPAQTGSRHSRLREGRRKRDFFTFPGKRGRVFR